MKVFDPELVERFGKTKQLARIEREMALRENEHEHVVKILDGGECENTGHLFVAMECVESPNLASVLKVFPREAIWPIISQIADAAKHLESLGLCHRDIKPENIAVTADYRRGILLDLGVLRPVGDPDLTDEEARHFIGTLRYSSPEFLERDEQDTIEGWRAVTFYQLGAVLHDLIMRKPLLHQYSHPFAVLVNAVKSVVVPVEANDVSPDLVLLARNCLLKDPGVRLGVVSWNDFALLTEEPSNATAAKQRVRRRRTVAQSEVMDATKSADQEARRREQVHRDVVEQLEAMARLECAGNDVFPPVEIRQKPAIDCVETTMLTISFDSSVEHGLSLPLRLVLEVILLDVDTRSIDVRCCACVSARNEGLESPQEGKGLRLFAGVYEESVVKSRLEDLLYVSMDEAQQVPISEGAAGTTWLCLETLRMKEAAEDE